MTCYNGFRGSVNMEKGYVRLASPVIQEDSIVDGEGIRSVIWFQGCSHNCEGCHNPETHDFNGGIVRKIEDLEAEIKELEFQSGITFSGGEPMMQIDALVELAKFTKSCDLNVWCYTGFTYEEILALAKKNSKYLEALNYIDVLVDGKFVKDLKSFEVVFRGSTNQRIIDVKKSLKEGKVVKVEKYC